MELKAEVEYQVKRMELEQQEEQRRINDSLESVTSEVPPPPEINPAAMEAITEQIQSLIIELTRCDDLIPRIALAPNTEGTSDAQDVEDTGEMEEMNVNEGVAAEAEYAEENGEVSTDDTDSDDKE